MYSNFSYEQEDESHYVGTYEIEEITEVDYVLAEGPGKRHKVDNGAQFIVPVPRPIGGILVLGDDVIHHISDNGMNISINWKPKAIRVNFFAPTIFP